MKKIKMMSRLLRLSRLLSIMSCSRQRIHSCHSCLMFRCCDNTLNNWTSKARSDERKKIISQSTMTGLDILTFFGASLWVGFKLFHISWFDRYCNSKWSSCILAFVMFEMIVMKVNVKENLIIFFMTQDCHGCQDCHDCQCIH